MKDTLTTIVIISMAITLFLAVHELQKVPIQLTCESKGEVLESFRYDEDKKQVILQCKR